MPIIESPESDILDSLDVLEQRGLSKLERRAIERLIVAHSRLRDEVVRLKNEIVARERYGD